jgi:hypothetical protein
MKTQPIYEIHHEPKSLQLEKTEDDRYRLMLIVKKLGAVTAIEFFLDPEEAQKLSESLLR